MFVIAGVTGHAGSVAAAELLASGAKVKVIVRDPKQGATWSQRGAEVATGELGNVAFLTSALKGASGFFALIPPSYTAPDFLSYQKQMATSIAAAVKASGVPHVVMLSSVGADLSEGNGPIQGLYHLEQALRATGTKLSAIRAGMFQENIGSSIAAARQTGTIPNLGGSAEQAIPQIATKDIGHQVAESLRHPPAQSEVVDLQGPSYSPRQVAEKLGVRLGMPLKIVDVAPAGHVAALTSAGFPPQIAKLFAEMYAAFASGKIKPHGDRAVAGKTTLDDTLAVLVPRA